MPAKTAEEKANLKKMVLERKPQLEQMKQAITLEDLAKQHQWDDEIAMLERRVTEEVAPVDLGHGDTLLIRTRISQAEGKRFAALFETWKSGTDEEKRSAAFEILELATANPKLTAEWFEQNEARFSALDTLPIVLGFIDNLGEPQRRVNRAASFRTDGPGAGTG